MYVDGSKSLEITAITDVDVGERVYAACYIGDRLGIVLATEVALINDGNVVYKTTPHGGPIISHAFANHQVITGGDDGNVVATSLIGERVIVASDPRGRWIDAVAARNEDVAFAAGRQAFLVSAGNRATLELGSSISGIAFVDDRTLLITHNNGVTIWSPRESSRSQTWSLKGANMDPKISPDRRLAAIATREPSMWLLRLPDGAHISLSGYSERVRSAAWMPDASYLVAAGSERVILWSSPQERETLYAVPALIAPHRAKAAVVACHPSQSLIAAGYADGLVLLVRLTDAAEIMVRRPDGASISALTWNSSGALAMATESGGVRLVRFSG